MTDTEMLRPAEAAARHKVSRQTLIAWADAGLIGRSRIRGVTLYVAQDIADLIAANLSKRTVMPISRAPVAAPSIGDDWRSDPLWRRTAR